MAPLNDIGTTCEFGQPLQPEWFDRDPLEVSRDLLGCVLVSLVDGELTAGRIVETEAYLGAHDPGSHAATKGITARNAVMYGRPGSVYVYFTYGNHHMLNLVCLKEGTAGAVLIRALEPILGIESMMLRRPGRPLAELCNGPGKLAQALGLDLSDNGSLLGKGRLHVYAGSGSGLGEVVTSGRVGLTNGHELPYRFYLKQSRFVSRGRVGPLMKRSRTRTSGEGSSQ